MKGMDVFSLHCQKEVIHQCHYSGFICVLACIQAVLGLLQLAKWTPLALLRCIFLATGKAFLQRTVFLSMLL